MSTQPVVRAIDVGYGHVKFSEGRDASGKITADRFPSQSPLASEDDLGVGVMQRRETFRVPVDGRVYEVGKGIAEALHGAQESAILDNDYAKSAPYAARLYGALNYMLPGLPGRVIDFLILGLPMNVYKAKELRAEVTKRFTGEQTINTKGEKILIRRCEVYPQPLGGYMAFLDAHGKNYKTPPEILILDPGYNTFDWFVCKGMTPNVQMCDAVPRGMSAVIKAIAQRVIRELKSDATPAEVVRMIDHALITGEEFMLHGQPVDLTKFMDAGKSVAEEAAQAAKNAIGSGAAIKAIALEGGGAPYYLEAVKAKFPKHPIEVLDEPELANARGFHALGELLAKSAQRAAVGTGGN